MSKSKSVNGKHEDGVPSLRFLDFADVWQTRKLGDITRIYDGTHQTPQYTDTGVPFYSVEHLTANNFKDTKYISEKVYATEEKRVVIESGDIIMTRIGDIGTAKYIDWDVRASFYVSLALIKQSDDYIGRFLEKYITTGAFQRELWRRTIHVAFPKKINLGEISNCIVKLPNTAEQQKIASFFTVVDTRIANQEQKLSLLKAYKKGVMQKIFTQQIRFKDENSKPYPEREERKVGDFLKERKEYASKDGQLEHISLTTAGVVPKSERYERDFLVGSEDKQYRITRLDDICYNPANLKFGVIARNKYRDGIFSPIYVTYEVKGADIGFIEHLVTSNNFIQRARKYEQGTVYERMAVGPNDLAKLKVDIPVAEEQQKIATFLTTLDDKIKSEQTRLNSAKTWRKGLLQRMFI